MTRLAACLCVCVFVCVSVFDLGRCVSTALHHHQQQYVDDALFLVWRHVVKRQREHVEELSRVKSDQCSEVWIGRLRAVRTRRVYGCHTRQHRLFHRGHTASGNLARREGVAGQTAAHIDQQFVSKLSLQTDRSRDSSNQCVEDRSQCHMLCDVIHSRLKYS